MRKIPNIKELFLKDYIILGPTFIGIVFIGLSIYFYYAENNVFGFYGLGGASIVLFGVAAIRIYVLKKLFTNGVEISGKIVKMSFYRGTCRFVLEFDYDSKHIKTAWIAVKNQGSRNLKMNTNVNVLINPKKLKQAIILDLFQ